MSNNVIRITDKLDVSDSNIIASSKCTSELKDIIDALDNNNNNSIREDTLAAAREAVASGFGGETGNLTLEGLAQAVDRLDMLADALENAQVGIPFPWPSNEVDPEDALLCNGAAISRTTYARLFSVMGTTWGEGDGSTTFNLPNLTDRFIQGSSTAGTAKEAGAPNITGKFGRISNYRGEDFWSNSALYKESTFSHVGWTAGGNENFNIIGFDASLSNAIFGASDTIQPPALTMRYFVRY